jgi:hypothetical protein
MIAGVVFFYQEGDAGGIRNNREEISYEKMKDKEYHGLALFFLGEA